AKTPNMVVANLKDKDELHYPFCQDLGQKRFFSLEKVLGEGQDKQMNLIWSLFRVKQTYGIFGGGSVRLPNSDIYLPGNYHIEKVNGAEYNFLDREKSYNVFVAPSDYPNRGKLFYEGKRELKFALPTEFKEQPHLFPHSTFQFLFLRNILFSTNLQFLDIDENNVIRATADIYAAPSGTFFVFKKVRQNVVVMDLMKETIEAFEKLTKKVGAGFIKIVSMGTVDLNENDFKTLGETVGEMSERISRIQEQQTERLFKSTYADAIDKTIEPTIFYSNSITFPYNLFDFFLRSFTPHWEVRVHGKLTLDYDPGGKMTECFARGVTFYENKDETEFPNPKLGIAGVVSSQLKIGHGAEFYTAQTIVEPGEGIT
ncbi:14668_t:CDS:2, partial [Cetraspora pellucida]